MFGRSKLDRVYSIESRLGSGGCGYIYKAWHKRLRMFVVIKEYRHRSKKDAGSGRNELEALKNVKCAFLPQVFDYFSKGKRSFTVMEYIEGESFDKLLDRGQRFNRAQVLKWYGQLASALEVLHRQNICHRDIKPSNIMLTPDGDACLIDFNTALVKGANPQFTSRSPGYASPEQHEVFNLFDNTHRTLTDNTRRYNGAYPCYDAETQLLGCDSRTELVGEDAAAEEAPTDKVNMQNRGENSWLTPDVINWKRSDIYSLGATMYHLITGEHPHAQAADASITRRSVNCNDSLTYIIEKSMQYGPSGRFVSAEVLTGAIRNALEYDVSRRGTRRRAPLNSKRPHIKKKIRLAGKYYRLPLNPPLE